MSSWDIKISSEEDLKLLDKYPQKNFILTDDIYLKDNRYIPEFITDYISIINRSPFAECFEGILDGSGHTIHGLKIGSKYSEYSGFIVKNKGTIKNLNLDGVRIISEKDAAGLVNSNYGKIKNCFVSGCIMGEQNSAGIGVINEGKINNCEFNGELHGDLRSGGIVSTNNNKVNKCCSSGTIRGSVSIGGIASLNHGDIELCSSDIIARDGEGPGRVIGGLVSHNSGNLTSSYFSGSIDVVPSSFTPEGLLTGQNSGEINNCYAGENDDFSLIGLNMGEHNNIDMVDDLESIDKVILAGSI